MKLVDSGWGCVRVRGNASRWLTMAENPLKMVKSDQKWSKMVKTGYR